MKIALVGKYVALHDAYLSVVEALTHGGIENDVKVEIRWVDSELVTDENAGESLGGCDGVLVPGGFGDRGIEGMISAIRYAREHGVPFFGICLGMQMAVVEFARHVAGPLRRPLRRARPRTGLRPGDRPDARAAGHHRQGGHHAAGGLPLPV